MTKVLLTGGSGFIAAHILEQLLQKGYKVLTTVRSEDKASKIREAYPHKSEEELSFAIVPDIAQLDAFDEVVKTPGIEVVLHTASPFHFNITDPHKDLIEPAVNGTEGILKAIARSAPSVRRVVVTSSFASLIDEAHLEDPTTTFTEKSWNPVTLAEIHRSQATAYRASKTLAEKAAWAFVDDKANHAKFELVTICPPLVIGPVVHYLASLEAINTSNQRLVDALSGKWKEGMPKSGPVVSWVDVRDVATAHVLAGLELPAAAGKRLFVSTGDFSNRETADIIRASFPQYADRLPDPSLHGGEAPPTDKIYKTDNSETEKLLGIKWIPYKKTVIDTVESLKPFL